MTQSQQLRKLAARSATAFLLAALCVFPLYIDKFSNLGVVKFTGICTLSWAFALWLGALACVDEGRIRAACRGKPTPHFGRWARSRASGVVSTVLSLSPGASFWGLGGYYGGCMMVLFTAAGYLAVRAFAPQKILNGLTFCVGVTTALVTVLYVLNIFNIDLIGTYADTAVVERAQFFLDAGTEKLLLRVHGVCTAACVLCVPRRARAAAHGILRYSGIFSAGWRWPWWMPRD